MALVGFYLVFQFASRKLAGENACPTIIDREVWIDGGKQSGTKSLGGD
jgi:hypothetical protein